MLTVMTIKMIIRTAVVAVYVASSSCQGLHIHSSNFDTGT